MDVNTFLVTITHELVVSVTYLMSMDDKWFKNQQKKVGVTAEDIANAIGRDRSLVSRIYVGRQKMTLEQAQVFADILKAPLDQVLEKAGLIETGDQKANAVRRIDQAAKGFSEGDAEPYRAPPAAAENANKIAAIFGLRPGVDIWTVNTDAMRLAGYLPGDKILVDTHKSEITRAGDVVIAQIYNWQSGEVKTVLRRHEPPVLIADSLVEEDRRALVVDGNNVVIKGKIVAQWRN